MFLHVRLLVEALAAVGAGVGAGVAVDEQVGRQRGRPLERLAALRALEALLLGVHRPVLRQADGVAERLVADVARERPPPAVGPPHVHLESVRSAELFQTLDALVRAFNERRVTVGIAGPGGWGFGTGSERAVPGFFVEVRVEPRVRPEWRGEREKVKVVRGQPVHDVVAVELSVSHTKLT